MSQIEIPYKELEQKFITELAKLGTEGEYLRAILATSENNKVTARKQRFISKGLKLWCYTDPRTIKVKQIKSNPNVAVVASFTQIEAIASIKGHPLEDRNADFLEAYKLRMPKEFERYQGIFASDRPFVLIEVNPTKITRPNLGKPSYSEILDIIEGKAYKIIGIEGYETPAYKK